MSEDLFGARPEKPKRARKPKKDTNPAVARCIDYFFQKFNAKFGFKPKINGGKDGKHFKELIETWNESIVLQLIDEMFSSSDPRILRSDYTIGAFYNLAQYLRLQFNRTDERTMRNLDASRRASRAR